MHLLYITFLFLSFIFLTGCNEKKTEETSREEALKKNNSTTEATSTVSIDGETSTFPYSRGQCMNPFGKGITAIISNDKMMFELGENSGTKAWRMHYNIPLGNRKYIQHSSISLDIVNENNVLKGTGVVKQNNKPEIKHNITFRIDCTKDLK